MKVKHILEKTLFGTPRNKVECTFRYGHRVKNGNNPVYYRYEKYEYQTEKDIPEFIRNATVSGVYIHHDRVDIVCYERPYCGKS